MEEVTLTEGEQTVLDAAASEVMAAQQRARQANEEAQAAGVRAQGAFVAIMRLKGLNPEALSLTWDGAAGHVKVTPNPAKQPPTPSEPAQPAPEAPAGE